jgi:hypothetical protein
LVLEQVAVYSAREAPRRLSGSFMDVVSFGFQQGSAQIISIANISRARDESIVCTPASLHTQRAPLGNQQSEPEPTEMSISLESRGTDKAGLLANYNPTSIGTSQK